MGATDLHFHLLPSVDDGPGDLVESLYLARTAAAEGTSTIVATPHVRHDLGLTDAHEIRERVEDLRGRLASARVAIELRCGGELGHDTVPHFGHAELELLAQGPPGARWLLVETPFEGIGEDFHAATAELRERGFGVLLAHPERSADASMDGSAGLRRELASGSLAQLNAQSLTGDHGHEAHAAAWRMVDQGLVAVIASDAHGPTRPPALRLARRALIAGGLEEQAAELLTGSAPTRLLTHGIRPRAAIAA